MKIWIKLHLNPNQLGLKKIGSIGKYKVKKAELAHKTDTKYLALNQLKPIRLSTFSSDWS